jgi:hypothetical protein
MTGSVHDSMAERKADQVGKASVNGPFGDWSTKVDNAEFKFKLFDLEQ